MKKIILLVIAAVSLSSCKDEVKFNNPTIEASVNDEFFRSNFPQAFYNADGTVTITGESEFGMMSITVESANPGTYYFGVNNLTVANYELNSGDVTLNYSTISGVDNPNMEENLGSITIFASNNPLSSKEGTLSGTFSFRGRLVDENPFGLPSVFVHEGKFYGVQDWGF